MLSEKKISSKGNGNEDDYFGELSKSLTDMYDNLQNNKSAKSVNQQVNNFAKSTQDFLGDTFNLKSDPFANPNPVPPSPVIEQNVTEIPNMLSQGPQLTPESPPLIPQGSQILSQGVGEIPEVSPKSSKTFMDVIEEPSKTFSGVFSSESKKETVFEAPKDYSTLETIITIILLFLFLVLIAVYAMQYFYGIDIVAKIKGIFTNHPEVEIKVQQEPEKKDTIDNDVSQILRKPQVFNIPENNYIYGDAQAVCKAYGARLATYQEVEEAYNKGAEWCNYGWSDGQMALFPTQQKTFDELQKIEGHENDCGRPGINGGFIDNPKLKYGVNCYGYKPRINKVEKEMMETSSIYPKTKKDIAMDERVEYWKERLSEIIVSPFNHEKWSKV
jgi:hypothetical protein